MPETPDPGDDPVGLWTASLDGIMEALDEPGVVDKVGTFWFGESSIDAHSSNTLADASIAVIGANADALRGMGLMGDPVDVPADADAMTRFIGLIGRDPAA